MQYSFRPGWDLSRPRHTAGGDNLGFRRKPAQGVPVGHYRKSLARRQHRDRFLAIGSEKGVVYVLRSES